jgi:tight adherence protein B
MIIGIIGALAVFALLLAIYFWLQMKAAQRQTSEVLEKYVGSTTEIGWSDRLVERLDQYEWAKNLEPQLKRASIQLRPAEYAAVLTITGFGLMFLLNMGMGAPLVVSVMIPLIAIPIASKMLISSRKFLYAQKIDGQLSEACRLMSSTARAGLSIPQGLELVVKEMDGPIQEELGIVVRELRLGKSLEVSLKDMLKRVETKDLHVFINALIIQRRAGGDLASVLGEMASTMEERKIIHKTIDATIAQARYSAYLMPLISIFIVMIMSQMVDNFFDFFSSTFGIIVLAVFVFLQIIGFILIRKIADIKV